MNSLTCFKAYDIRGRLGVELDEGVAYRIGRATGQYLEPATMVVGGDIRTTSDALKAALTEGLRDAGVDVLDLGMTGTEEIYFATKYLGVDGGVEVTASHNPIDYNGMKLVQKDARPISGDTGLLAIKSLAERNNFPEVSHKGAYEKKSTLDAYISHILSYVDLSVLPPMKLVVNAGNGSAGPVLDAIEKRLKAENVPVELIKIHHEPNGSFPNGIPNPLLEENRAPTREAVIRHGADLGIAWDGDFDRCFLFDEKGQFVEGYYMVALLAEAFLDKDPNATIIHDPRLTWNTIDVVKEKGGTPIQSRTGHAFIKEKMREMDAVYGGEMSAHHYFRDFAYCDSGMIPWLLVIDIMARKGKPLSKLVTGYMKAFPASGEINRRLDDPGKAINRVKSVYEERANEIDSTDGISMSFDDWRFNLRKSNTEPVVRLNVEARANRELMEEKTAELLSLLAGS